MATSSSLGAFMICGAQRRQGWLLSGFQPHVIERVLNHVSGAQGGLVSVYQRHEYREERKRAIMAWGDHLMQLVSGAAPSVQRHDAGQSQICAAAAGGYFVIAPRIESIYRLKVEIGGVLTE